MKSWWQHAVVGVCMGDGMLPQHGCHQKRLPPLRPHPPPSAVLVQNLLDHLADPVHNNLLGNFAHGESELCTV